MNASTLPSTIEISCIRSNPGSKWDNDLVESAIRIDAFSKTVDLRHNKIRNIDLQPIGHVHKLEELRLSFNELRAIDLNPLANCPDLRILDLGVKSDSAYSGNTLHDIDLSPISFCRRLETLNIRGNQLRQVDLRPLRQHESLLRIDLSRNPIREIDLSPLSDCARLESVDLSGCELESVSLASSPSLQSLSLDGNRLTSVDLTPLSFCDSLTTLRFVENPLDTVDIGPLASCGSLDLANESYSAQILMLNHLGVPELSGFDGNLLDLIRQESHEDSYHVSKTRLYRRLVTELEIQIGTGGPTLFLDIERMATTSAASLIDSIVDRRRREIMNTVVLVSGESVDLRPLWVTDYGFRLLSALRTGLDARRGCLPEVQQTLLSAGMELRITKHADEEEYGVNVSDAMKAHVFKLAHQSRELEIQLRGS